MDKSYVEVPRVQIRLQETRLAAAKMLNEKTGSFKGWADDAKSDLNNQLKKQVDDALNIDHFKDFKVVPAFASAARMVSAAAGNFETASSRAIVAAFQIILTTT